jgi:hypothetical protein
MIYHLIVFASRILEFIAAKEKLEIVICAAHFDFAQYEPPLFRHTTTAPLSAFAGCRIFAGGLPRSDLASERKRFGLIQE